jgi:ABC-2 type transport system permease protein
METLLATPVEPLEVMLGKLAPYVGIGLIQTTIILVLARLLFHVPFVMGGWGALALGVALFIVGSLSLGFFFSTLAAASCRRCR